MVKKVNILKVMKKILLCIWWQDIEKSNFLLRIFLAIVPVVLSLCVYAWLHESNMNLFLKIIIGFYIILNILLFWPVNSLLDEKDKIAGATFYINKNISFVFSFIILFIYFMKKENHNDKVKEENHEDKVSG